MRRGTLTALAMCALTVALLAAGLVVLEGVRSLASGRTPRPSLTVGCLARLGWCEPVREVTATEPIRIDRKARVLLESNFVCDEAVLRDLLPALTEAHVLLGNSPFKTLAHPEARITRDDPELGLVLKPGLDFETGFLRSFLYSPWDPVTYSIPVTNRHTAAPEVRALLDTYGFGVTRLTSDADGFRTTVPAVEAEKIILVVGDSVAFGAGVGDEQTLASCLQRRTASVRYINAGVPGSDGRENAARLRHVLKRLNRPVAGLIYVHCENDYAKGVTPADIVTPIADIADAAGIPYRVMVYQQYLQRAVPDVFRTGVKANYLSYKPVFFQLAQQRGFTLVDTSELVQNHCQRHGSLLAGAGLYIDHCHFSADGLQIIAAEIPAPDGSTRASR